MYKANFCIQCGAKIDPGDNFCTVCGTKIELYEDDLEKYRVAIEDQVDKYEAKEKKVLEMIEKRFKPTELTYAKFTGTIANCRQQFYSRVSVAMEIVEIFHDSDDEIERELKREIKTLEKITDQLSNLIKEFIIHPINEAEKNHETDDLFNDLDDLINSVEDYK